MIKGISKKNKLLIRVYFFTLIFLLLTVSFVPLLIRHGLALSRDFIIEEEVLETCLILFLFGISYLIWIGLRRRMLAYQRAAESSGKQQSRLVARLVDAFKYIGSFNVEVNQTMTVLCGLTNYPLTKKELKEQFHQMATQIMSIAHTPWTIIRMIQRSNGRTIKEYTFESAKGAIPSAAMGNRAILEGRCAEGLKTIGSCQKNLDLHTVIILPATNLPEEETLLIAAVLNQIEMLFLLFQAGCLQHYILNDFDELTLNRAIDPYAMEIDAEQEAPSCLPAARQ